MGALTNKQYTFKGRPWELEGTQTIDITNRFFLPILTEHRGLDILRILPVVGTEEWITNAARFIKTRIITKGYTQQIKKQTNCYLKYIKCNVTIAQYRKTALKESLKSILSRLIEKQEFTIIVGPKIDILVIKSLRQFQTLKDILNITLFFKENQKNIIYNNASTKITDLVISLVENYTPRVYTIINELDSEFYDIHFEEYFINSYSPHKNTIGSLKDLFRILEGSTSYNKATFFISNGLAPWFTMLKNVILFGNTNTSLFLGPTYNYNLLFRKKTNLLFLDSGFLKFVPTNTIFPVATIWYDTRVFVDFWGLCVKATRTVPSWITSYSLIFALFSIIQKKIKQN